MVGAIFAAFVLALLIDNRITQNKTVEFTSYERISTYVSKLGDCYNAPLCGGPTARALAWFIFFVGMEVIIIGIVISAIKYMRYYYIYDHSAEKSNFQIMFSKQNEAYKK